MENLSASQGTPTRNVTDEAQRAELLAAYEASGLTQRAFAAREGINYHTFISWLTQQRRAEAASSSSVRQPTITERSVGTNGGHLEVTLPGEIVVRGSNPHDVAKLVHSLRNSSHS